MAGQGFGSLLRGLLAAAVVSTSGLAQLANADPSGPLDSFYRDLNELEQQHRHQVQIVQLGDSHTAGDIFTGHLRELLQGRFGNAGRGTVAPGLPYRGAIWSEFTVAQTGRWKVFNSRNAPNAAEYGISGFQLASVSAGASMTATMAESGWFD